MKQQLCETTSVVLMSSRVLELHETKPLDIIINNIFHIVIKVYAFSFRLVRGT